MRGECKTYAREEVDHVAHALEVHRILYNVSPSPSGYREPTYRSDGHNRNCTCSRHTRVKEKRFEYLIFEILGNKEEHLTKILSIASFTFRDAREMIVVVVIANNSTRTSYNKSCINQESCCLSLMITPQHGRKPSSSAEFPFA